MLYTCRSGTRSVVRVPLVRVSVRKAEINGPPTFISRDQNNRWRLRVLSGPEIAHSLEKLGSLSVMIHAYVACMPAV